MLHAAILWYRIVKMARLGGEKGRDDAIAERIADNWRNYNDLWKVLDKRSQNIVIFSHRERLNTFGRWKWFLKIAEPFICCMTVLHYMNDVFREALKKTDRRTLHVNFECPTIPKEISDIYSSRDDDLWAIMLRSKRSKASTRLGASIVHEAHYISVMGINIMKVSIAHINRSLTSLR